MMKPFLLIAGDSYYPEKGTLDWVGCFETIESAESQIQIHKKITWFLGKKEETQYFVINNKIVDWYDIVDLRKWVFDG